MLLNMKIARITKNITQKQLSELTGVSRCTIASLENGYTNPYKTKYGTLKTLSNALSITVDELVKENK